jgi:hypothetical protein
MAVMARILQIPARVAVGFTAGSYDRKSKTHVVTLHDAHAWPELYFENTGWVRFEPTPAGARTTPPAYAQPAAAGGAPGGPSGFPGGVSNPTPTRNPGLAGSENRFRSDILPREGRLDQPSGAASDQQSRPFPVLPVSLAVGALLLAAVPWTVRTWVRRRRWRRATTPAALTAAAWAELQDTLLDYGYSWPASDPPRRGAARLADDRGLTGEPAAALHRVAAATERARYAAELGSVGDLRGDVDQVRRALAEEAGRKGRLRAQLLPRSTRAVSRALSERTADLLDNLDNLGARLRPRRTG